MVPIIPDNCRISYQGKEHRLWHILRQDCRYCGGRHQPPAYILAFKRHCERTIGFQYSLDLLLRFRLLILGWVAIEND